MPSPHGSFTWYELITPNAAAAAEFYGAVVGWNARPVAGGPMDYTVLQMGETGVAGILTLPAGGPPPVWLGYISVDDLDAHLDRLTKAGGSIHQPPVEIPDMLRFSVVADPQGAAFVLFQPYSDAAPPPALPDKPGFTAWRELMAGDGAAAFDFYSSLFGWTKAEAHDMGPMGVYQLFADKGETVGGMMTKPPNLPAPAWTFYFRVDAIGAAAERLKTAGGTVVNGPMQVPGGDWIVQAQDPQGAKFALHSPNP